MALLAMAATPLLADVSCPPTTPWPPVAGPIVKTVPWIVPQPPLCSVTPHDTISGKAIYLKATTVSTAKQYYWDYGDGAVPMAWTNVTDPYNIGVQHTYTGAPNTAFVATVYVRDNALPVPNVNSAKYFVTIRATALDVRANIAIDEGLWRLHREMRSRGGAGAEIVGYWNGGAYTGSDYIGNNAVNATAFLVNGHKPDSDLTNPNPYAETVLRGLNRTLNGLAVTGIPTSVTNARGTFNPDDNGNGNRVYVPESDMYEGGMVMDMLVATGLPDYVAATGPMGVVGQTFKTIVQDMMDDYTYCQTTGYGSYNGGWRYGCRYSSSDNSICQWAAIGMLAAVDKFDLRFPPPIPGPPAWAATTTYALGNAVLYNGKHYKSLIAANLGNQPDTAPMAWAIYKFVGGNYQSPVITANMDWLTYDYNGTGFGYDGPGSYPWGPWAVIPSGMVQLVMDEQVAGTPGNPTMWDHVENYIRSNFSGPLGYYYGLFSFTKSMLLYPGGAKTNLCARDGFPSNNPTSCIDWYAADTAAGDPISGVAKTLVSAQQPDGYWWCSYQGNSTQCYFNTAWAVIMLNKTVYSSGLPVAVIDASPTTIVNGGTVNFTGKNSIHQDATKQIMAWDWDFSGTGTGPFNVSGVNQNNVVIHTPLITYPVQFPVRLRVTDNSTPIPQTAISTLIITITNPPFPPTANAGGPYNICPQPAYLPFYFNGSGSKDGTNGGHSAACPGCPPNQITLYEWDPRGNGTYPLSGATLSQPRVDDYYQSQGLLGSGATVPVNLRVTDNSAASYPPSPNLTGTASTSVVLRLATDLLCSKCVTTGQAIPHGAVPGKAGYIALVWLETGANHYNIYRGTVNGGPYVKIGTVANNIVNTGKSLGYADNGPLTAGVTYYYRIAPATLADIETCQSNQANASGSLPKGR